MRLRRHEANPVLQPRGDDWESLEVYNPAVAQIDNEIHLLYRATGEYVEYVSRLGHAVFDENLHLVERSDEPCFVPDPTLWERSVEDARLTALEGRLYMTYVITPTPCPPSSVRRRLGLPPVPQAHTRISLAEVTCESRRLSFQRLGIITPYGSNQRDTVLFPERIGGRYAALHRPSSWIGPDYPTDTPASGLPIWMICRVAGCASTNS